jgi:malic enzyme
MTKRLTLEHVQKAAALLSAAAPKLCVQVGSANGCYAVERILSDDLDVEVIADGLTLGAAMAVISGMWTALKVEGVPLKSV